MSGSGTARLGSGDSPLGGGKLLTSFVASTSEGERAIWVSMSEGAKPTQAGSLLLT